MAHYDRNGNDFDGTIDREPHRDHGRRSHRAQEDIALLQVSILNEDAVISISIFFLYYIFVYT
jgi:hypothetical protein